ncbi:MAG TPA: ribosomal protein S18-alanine N-acetyltransferase [Chloroflexia bacterium]|nr:ribosomal protein S18-alanine N-acetyltransferase [Chloroflexia bacterium]
MPTGFAIEPMRMEDIPEVVEIERVCFSMPWPASAYKRELKNPNSTRYLVARHYLTEPPALTPPPIQKKPGLIERVLPFLKNGSDSIVENGPKNPNPIIGYGGLWLMMDEAHITTLGVSPEYRGRGLGEFLLVGLIDVAMALGASWLTLEVRVSNTVAQNLYNKYTFKEAGVRRKYYTDNNEDAYIMWSDELTKPAFKEKYKTLKAELLQRMAKNGDLAAPAGSAVQTDPAQPLVEHDFEVEKPLTPPDPPTEIATEQNMYKKDE